jgi:hypothetical protein
VVSFWCVGVSSACIRLFATRMSVSKQANVRVSALYRALLQAAREFDHNKVLRTGLCLAQDGKQLRSLPLLQPPHSAPPELLSACTQVQSLVISVVTSFLEPWTLYRPDKLDEKSLVRHVQRAFRKSSVSEAIGLDAAYNAAHMLANIAQALKIAPASGMSLPTSVRALSKSEALQPGQLLVEHPAVVAPGRCVALVYDISKNVMEIHKNEDWMVRCYVINRPIPGTVSSVLKLENLGHFGQLPIFHGGQDSSSLAVIHSHGDIEGAAAVDESDKPLYVGGSVDSINKSLQAGRSKPSDFKVVFGSLDIRLSGPEENLELPDDDRYYILQGEGVTDLTLLPPLPVDATPPSRPEEYNAALFHHQNATWRAALESMAIADTAGSGVAACASVQPASLHNLALSLPMTLKTPFSYFQSRMQAQKATVPTTLKERIQDE